MEKQKLALEKEHLVQQKALEVERLKLEKQKQEFEYAKLQARLAEMDAERKENELQPKATTGAQRNLQASLDRKSLDSRRAARDYYKLALFPIKASSVKNWESRFIRKIINAIARVADDDAQLEFSLSYRLVDSLPSSVKPLEVPADGHENQVWTKKSILSEYEPGWDYLKTVSSKIDTDLIVMVNFKHVGNTYMDIFLYACERNKRYSRKNLLGGTLSSQPKNMLKNFYRDRE